MSLGFVSSNTLQSHVFPSRVSVVVNSEAEPCLTLIQMRNKKPKWLLYHYIFTGESAWKKKKVINLYL